MEDSKVEEEGEEEEEERGRRIHSAVCARRGAHAWASAVTRG